MAHLSDPHHPREDYAHHCASHFPNSAVVRVDPARSDGRVILDPRSCRDGYSARSLDDP